MTANGAGAALTCAEVRDLAPELALGILSGRQRADAVAHLQDCPSCRRAVEELAGIGDSLLTLGPEVEPPAGFESRALARRTPARVRRARFGRRPVAAGAVAAAVAAAAAVGAVVGINSGGQPAFRVQYPGAVHAMGGRAFAATALRSGDRQVGQAFVYDGQPSWVFMTLSGEHSVGPITCRMTTERGKVVTLGSFTVTNGYGSWGSTTSVDAEQINQLQLIAADGRVIATGSL